MSTISIPDPITLGGTGIWSGTDFELHTSYVANSNVFPYNLASSTTNVDAYFTFTPSTGVVTFAVNSTGTHGAPSSWEQAGVTATDGDAITPGNTIDLIWNGSSLGNFIFDTSWISNRSTNTEGAPPVSDAPAIKKVFCNFW